MSLSKEDIRLPPILWHEKSGICRRKFSKRPRFKCYTPKNNARKCFIGKKSLAVKDLCTESYFECKGRMAHESSNCDGAMGTKDDVQMKNMSYVDDQTENKFHKKGGNHFNSNSAEQQATLHGAGNYVCGENRMKKQSNNCDRPMGTKGADDTENKMQNARKRRRKSQKIIFTERQPTADRIDNCMKDEDRMKQLRNKNDDRKFAETQQTTGGVVDKSITDGIKKPPSNSSNDPKFAEQQYRTEVVGEESRNNELNEDRMILQSNTSNDSTDNKIGSKRRKRRRRSKFAEHQETENVISEAHINGKDRLKPQSETCGSLVVNKKRERT